MTEKYRPTPPSEGVPARSAPADHEGYSESSDQIFERYLTELNLSEADLANKQILDVGSGSAGFAKAVQDRNIGAYVVSVEDDVRSEEPSYTKEGYVQARAQQLPFADNTFDMVVSVHAMPHVAALFGPLGTPIGETLEGLPVRSVTKEDTEKYADERVQSVAQAVRECVRVVKEGGEVRFGGVPVKKPKNEYDEEGFPQYPRVIRNSGAMEGMLEGMEDIARFVTYPEQDGENLFVLRKLTFAERPWPESSVPSGTSVQLETIDIHPEFKDVSKKFTGLASEIVEEETGKRIPPNEIFGQLMKSEGVVDAEGGARFPLGDDPDDFFRIPPGYWRLNLGH